jgi:hypothetical protein
MGHLARALRRRLAGSSCGVWLFLPVARISDPVAFVARAVAAAPIALDGGRLASGAVATNDPASARRVLTLLWVGRRWREVVDRWRALCDASEPALAPHTAWMD